MSVNEFAGVIDLLNPFAKADLEPVKLWMQAAQDASESNSDELARKLLTIEGLTLDGSAFEAVDLMHNVGLGDEAEKLQKLLTGLGIARAT